MRQKKCWGEGVVVYLDVVVRVDKIPQTFNGPHHIGTMLQQDLEDKRVRLPDTQDFLSTDWNQSPLTWWSAVKDFGYFFLLVRATWQLTEHVIFLWLEALSRQCCGYVFQGVLGHRVEGQYHPNDGHPLQKVFAAWSRSGSIRSVKQLTSRLMNRYWTTSIQAVIILQTSATLPKTAAVVVMEPEALRR